MCICSKQPVHAAVYWYQSIKSIKIAHILKVLYYGIVYQTML